MTYYVIEISTGDAKISGKGIYEFESEKDAVAMFHSKLGVAMKSDLYASDLVMVIDEFGNVLKRERYTAETTEAAE